MKVSISAVMLLVVVGIVNSQYSYPSPKPPASEYTYQAPKNTYLPPTTYQALKNTYLPPTTYQAPKNTYLPPTTYQAPKSTYVAPTTYQAPKRTYVAPTPYQAPKNTYLPPTTASPYVYQAPKSPVNTYLPPVTERAVASVYNAPDSEYQAGSPYDFTYSVKEDEYANDYSRKEQSDGENVKGEYRTLLPDGRVQVVRYTADWKNGYNAKVTYEGNIKY